MKTYSYVSMADLLEELPEITEEKILKLAEENRIPQPMSSDTKDAIIKEGDVLFPSVTKQIMRATKHLVLNVERGGWRIDIEDLVSIAINNEVLPFYARLWLGLDEHGEFSPVIHETTVMLKNLHRPTVFEDLEAQCASQHRVYNLINIVDNIMNPAVLNTVSHEELEEAIELLKRGRSRVPLQQRLNVERKIRTAEHRLTQLAN